MMIETERLLLRPFCPDDLELIERLYCDEEILKFTPFDALTRTEAAAHLERIVREFGQPPANNFEMAVLRKETGEKIGRTHIEINRETDTGMIGWFLLPEHWGCGYAAELTAVLIGHCFDVLHLHRVNAVCNPENEASRRALERCGMRLEAHFRQKCRYVKRGVVSFEDELEYAILASERQD